MKILMLTLNYAPEVCGVGKYSTELAEWLEMQGHEVRVITASPYYPDWRVHDGYSPLKYATETINGVSVTRVPFWCPRNPSGLKRILHLMSFSLTSALPAIAQLRWRPDVVWAVAPPLFACPTAMLVARLSGGLCWFHIQDYEIDAAFRLRMLKGAVLERLILKFERALLSRGDGVSTPSEAMTRRALGKGVAEKRLVTVPNWVDTTNIRPMDRVSAYRGDLNIDADSIVVLYAGNLGAKQGLELITDAASLLQNRRDIVFVVCGNGHARDDLARRAASLPNVRLIGFQPNEQFNELMGLADIHLLPQRADAADVVMPSKLGAMLSSGKPVVVTAAEHTDLWNVVNPVGIVTEPGNAAALSEAIEQLAGDESLRRRLGALGRDYAISSLSKEHILSAFESRLLGDIRRKRGLRAEPSLDV
ncbi:glycosyltransferase WbuB [Caballeronia megalochromosomata]|jgi:colanic acid biosynthesis glycosyl transferase WcaI|nr:glycosyltransferase WbuB [Caballeronia megalochromosomata]